MTYAGYLLIFLGGPLLLLGVLTAGDCGRLSRSAQRRQSYCAHRRETGDEHSEGPHAVGDGSSPRNLQAGLENSMSGVPAESGRLGGFVLLLHVIMAVAYTTPWDNYLVATHVWWYDPRRILGPTLGWVPLEEYAFFVLQTLMVGLWLLWLMRRRWGDLPVSRQQESMGDRLLRFAAMTRLIPVVVVTAIWLAAVAALALGWRPTTYLALELAWFLPPIALQLIFGADVLWQQRRLVTLALLPPVTYLPLTDSLAIAAGVWTIDPTQTLGIMLAGVLPVEEFVFFALTSILIVFGMTLMISLFPQVVPEKEVMQKS